MKRPKRPKPTVAVQTKQSTFGVVCSKGDIRAGLESPRFSFEGDIDIGIEIDVDMDID